MLKNRKKEITTMHLSVLAHSSFESNNLILLIKGVFDTKVGNKLVKNLKVSWVKVESLKLMN